MAGLFLSIDTERKRGSSARMVVNRLRGQFSIKNNEFDSYEVSTYKCKQNRIALYSHY